MSYLIGLQKVLSRLEDKHHDKRESYLLFDWDEINSVLKKEFKEWEDSLIIDDYKLRKELDEVADVAISAILKIEWLWRNSVVEFKR